MILSVAALVGSHLLWSQSSTPTDLNEVTITANKIDQKQMETGKVVSVIDQAMIQRNMCKSIAELLNQATGIFMNGANNPLGTNLELYFRGANTGNILILMDGNPINDASLINNSFDLNHISLAQIEKIEIIKGAQSTIWGSDAMAGVINIITKKPSLDKVNLFANLNYGSYNTIKADVGVNGNWKKIDYLLNTNFVKSDGFTAARDTNDNTTNFTKSSFDKDGFQQMNVQAKLGYRINEHLKVSGQFLVTKYKTSLDAGPFTDDKDNTADNFNNINNLTFKYNKDKWSFVFTNTYIHAKRKYLDDSTDISSSYSKFNSTDYKGNTLTNELYTNYRFSKNTNLLLGVQNNFIQSTYNYLSVSDFGNYIAGIGDSAKVNNTALYSSFLFSPYKQFKIDAGFRLNRNSQYGNNATFTFNPSYLLDNENKLFVNVSSAYKIPTIYQLYSEAGNKDLKPEESINYEVGYQYNTADFNFGVVGFKRDINNLIVYVFDPNTFQGKYFNKNEQHDYGVEIECKVNLTKHIQYVGNMTYTEGKGISDGVSVNNYYRRPNFVSNNSIIFNYNKFSINPLVKIVGERKKGEYDLGDDILKSYLLVDCRLGYAINKHLNTFMDLRNITNTFYIDAPGYNNRRFNFNIGLSGNF